MNISFFDGVNDGKFYSINAGKYDELGEDENIDISTEVEEDDEDDADTCLNRFAALEKDISKLHMDLNNLRNEFKGSCKDWNNLSDTVDHMLNGIAELRIMMDKADDRLNKRLNVISEANVVLTDKLNVVEKKLEVFKCIDILDRVTKLEEQIKPTALEEAKELEVRPSVLDDILDRLGKLEAKSNSQKIYSGRLGERIDRIEKKVNEELDWKDLTGTTVFESIKNGILDSIKRLEEDRVSNDIQNDAVNHPKHYTDGKYECIDFIEEYGMLTHVGNAIKYITRAGIKDEKKYAEDLNKAFWYLHRYNTPKKLRHIDPFDYAHDKMLADDLIAVISAIVCEDYKEAEKLLGDYIIKLTGKAPKALEDEQSK